MFALATGELEAPEHFNRVLAAGASSVSRAIVRGVREATGLGGIPSVGELSPA
jgi:L-aminopeptidase/D-esterase-like protein